MSFPLVQQMPGCTSEAIYWKEGTGGPSGGGSCGYDVVYRWINNGQVAFEITTKPVGSVEIDEAEYTALRTAWETVG